MIGRGQPGQVDVRPAVVIDIADRHAGREPLRLTVLIQRAAAVGRPREDAGRVGWMRRHELHGPEPGCGRNLDEAKIRTGFEGCVA